VRLPDACAGGNGTFVAVPKLLTAAPGEAPPSDTRRPSLLALAHAGGARTAYINNHETWVLPEAGHDLVQKISSTGAHTLDEVAVEAAEDFIRREAAAASVAVVLHLYGQHFFYEDRYPGDLFGAEPADGSPEALEALRYQRAAEYGAHVLARAARMLDSLPVPAYLVFTSDHGENLLSDGTGKHFHAGPVNGRHDTLVPALVLWNRAFARSGRPQRLQPLLAAAQISHRDVALAWLALLGAPHPLAPPLDPMTWGTTGPGQAAGPLRCADLPP
jgi:heptose-I-phosphate ethanolaminephosphotransferase